MIRNGLFFVALAAAFIFLGCSSPKPDDLVKEQIRQWDQAGEILEGVKDEADLGDASRRLDSLAQKMLDTNKKAEGLKMSAQDAETLQAENRKETAAALQRFNDASKKVRTIPGGEAMLIRFQRLAMRTF